MIPSVGRIVHYKLAAHDLDLVKHGAHDTGVYNTPREGDVIPFLICRVWVWADDPTETTCVNGQGFIDGDFSIWLTSRQQGDQPGQWSDPRA